MSAAVYFVFVLVGVVIGAALTAVLAGGKEREAYHQGYTDAVFDTARKAHPAKGPR